MTLDVSLRLLRAFATVAETGHVGRAAQRLYVSQPSLSQDIRRLEKAVRVTLFTRTSRGMELTPPGQELFDGVTAGLRSIDRAAQSAAVIGGLTERSITVAFTPSVGNRLMPGLLPVLAHAVPTVNIDEREVDTGEVDPGVREGRFDLGFAHCPARHTDLSFTLLAEERCCVALAADCELAGQSVVGLSQVRGLEMLLWPRETAPQYYDHLVGICEASGFTPRIVTGPRRAIIRAYLLSTRSTFCLLPASASELRVPGIVFLDVADEHAHIPLFSIRRADDARDDVSAVEAATRTHCDSLLAS